MCLCAPFSAKTQAVAVPAVTDSLLDAGRYDDAALVLERLLFQNPADTVRYRVALQLARCYTLQEEYTLAEQVLAGNLSPGKDTAAQYGLHLQRCLVALLQRNYEECLMYLSRVKNIYPDSAGVADVTGLTILALNGKAAWQEARKVYTGFVHRFSQPADTAVYLQAYNRIPTLKSEAKAEALATIPLAAAGLWYAGRPGEAILNTLLQAGFLYFGLNRILAKEYITGALVGVGLYASFYTGGKKRAIKLVHDRNRSAADVFNNQVRQYVLAILAAQRNG
jgi:hypothetical protein